LKKPFTSDFKATDSAFLIVCTAVESNYTLKRLIATDLRTAEVLLFSQQNTNKKFDCYNKTISAWKIIHDTTKV